MAGMLYLYPTTRLIIIEEKNSNSVPEQKYIKTWTSNITVLEKCNQTFIW
jgi:hypothetical protein